MEDAKIISAMKDTGFNGRIISDGSDSTIHEWAEEACLELIKAARSTDKRHFFLLTIDDETKDNTVSNATVCYSTPEKDLTIMDSMFRLFLTHLLGQIGPPTVKKHLDTETFTDWKIYDPYDADHTAPIFFMVDRYHYKSYPMFRAACRLLISSINSTDNEIAKLALNTAVSMSGMIAVIMHENGIKDEEILDSQNSKGFAIRSMLVSLHCIVTPLIDAAIREIINNYENNFNVPEVRNTLEILFGDLETAEKAIADTQA